MLWISCTVHKRLQYSPSNCFSILLETPRALTSHDFIVRAIPSCIAFICLVIVAALLSLPFRAKFSLLFRIININNFTISMYNTLYGSKIGNEHADYKCSFSHTL